MLEKTRWMLGKHVKLVILILTASGLGSAVMAGRAQAPLRRRDALAAEHRAAQEAVALSQVRGAILAIDTHVGRVTLQVAQARNNFRVDPTTTIFVHGHTGALKDLAVGETVCTTYEAASTGLVAQWIEPCQP